VTSISDSARRQSALMSGPVGEMLPVERFPAENTLLARDRYSYEGNWLFCTFDQPDILAARIGFGLGVFHWPDYGLKAQQDATVPLGYRLEVVTPAGVAACLYSDPHQGASVQSDPAAMEIRFPVDHVELFHLHGWPDMSWEFRSPDASIGAELQLSLKNMAVWPDCIMPHNTFSMCIGVCAVSGVISLRGRRHDVTGGAVYDHPRVVVRSNAVPPFGWYLYAPLRFSDGTFVVSYYAEDGLGRKDEYYSTGFITLPDGTSCWMRSTEIRQLKLDENRLPIAWETRLIGEGISISYCTGITDLSLLPSAAASDQSHPTGKYLAFPLLMEAEGEYRIDGVTTRIEHGAGIAEFLKREGYSPVFP
jgi:hypothetical protein